MVFALLALAPLTFGFVKVLVDLTNYAAQVDETAIGRQLLLGPNDYIDHNPVQMSFIYIGYFTSIAGVIGIVLWAHQKAADRLKRPFVLFLRRFSGFADRGLIADLIASMPQGVPLVFVASRQDHLKN